VNRFSGIITGLGYFVLLIPTLFISACSVKLVHVSESLPKLNLSKEQQTIVKPEMMLIKEIADKYEIEKKQFEKKSDSMRSELKNRGTTGSNRKELRQSFQQIQESRKEFMARRDVYLSSIKIHIANIKAILNKDQLNTFEKMKMPELKAPKSLIPGGQPGFSGRRSTGERGGGGHGGDMMF